MSPVLSPAARSRSPLFSRTAACSDSAAACVFRSFDDGVDLLARVAHLVVHLRVEPPAHLVLAVAHRLFARTQLPLGLVDGGAFLRQRSALLLERAKVVVDAGEVLGELLLAARSGCPRAAAMTDGGMPSRAAISIARLRPAIRRRADTSARTSRG